jgi:N-acetylmuramoyl-L-alanine amidase
VAPIIDKSLRLPPNAYFPGAQEKSGLAVHHTVGGSARSTFDYWKGNEEQVGTAYIIDRDGTIYEVFEPAAWAWQFGLKWSSTDKIAFEKRFIGIEIASEGGLIESGGQLYCFGTVSPRTLKPRTEAFDCGKDYRGFRYFDRYEPAQVSALCGLISWLCDTFHIEKQVPANPLEYRGEALKGFKGIIGHTMVRLDKTDPLPDPALWSQLCATCGLTVVDDLTSPPSRRKLSEADVEQLFQDNTAELNKMDVAAGSMVKGLIMELERNGRATYLRLHDAEPGGHAIQYDLVQGDASLVGRIAGALGFAAVTPTRLEVRHA